LALGLGLGLGLGFVYTVIYTPVFAILIATFSRWTCVSQYQNVSIVDFISWKVDGDGGDSWRHKMHKAAVI